MFTPFPLTVMVFTVASIFLMLKIGLPAGKAGKVTVNGAVVASAKIVKSDSVIKYPEVLDATVPYGPVGPVGPVTEGPVGPVTVEAGPVGPDAPVGPGGD
jgi:hypothetical protein